MTGGYAVDGIDGGEKHNAVRGADLRGSERRRHGRRSGLWSAQLETAQGAKRNCLVLDVSQTGAKLRVEQPAAPGDVITLSGDRFGTRRGRVVWAGNHRIGIIFLDAAAAAKKTPAADPKFLRGRAEILRRLARSAQGGDAAAGLFRLAQALDSEAAEIEKTK
jgi:PilZ domain